MTLLQIHEPGQTPLPHAETRAVGIDLGTTNSVVAISESGKAQAIDDGLGRTLQPSAVYYGDESAQPVVGTAALEKRRRGEKGAVTSIKRLMGRSAEDARRQQATLPYDIAPDHEGMVKLLVGGKPRTPVEISADILRHMRHIAEQALGKDVKQAVITVPAYFDDAARQATKDAAKIAGLEVLRLLNEPTAAALAYGLDHASEGIYAVYDLGGGTFDISLLKLDKGVFQVLATGGDAELGGDDIDEKIAQWSAFKTATPEAQGALLAEARRVKEELTRSEAAIISYGGKTATLTLAEFESLAAPLVERSLAICSEVLADAGLAAADVKGVVMVGGSTRIPLVRRRVGELFGQEPLVDVNPDEVVAVGAAIQAEGLTQGSDHLLLDVIPLSLGLETMGGLTEKLVYRNTPIPVSVAQEFTTYQDNQTGMKIHVVQGEREMAEHNRSLARFELAGIPPLPMGIARVQVTFTVDADGLLTVTAREELTGSSQSVHVKPSYGLDPAEMERMLLESMEKARTDIMARLLAESRIGAEVALREVESALKADSDLLAEAERRAIESQMAVLRRVMRQEDRDMIDAETQQLGKVAQFFAERRMDRAIASALKGVHVNQAV